MDRPRHLIDAAKRSLQEYAIGIFVGFIFLCILPSYLRVGLLWLGGAFYVATNVAPLVASWCPKRRLSVDGKAVFITGCDSGFGHSLALRLDKLGFLVFAGCLFPDAEGASKLRKSTTKRMHVVALDVTQDHSVQSAKDYAIENLKDFKLWAVVNNAGVNDGSEMLWTNVDIVQKVMEVNAIGVVRVTKAFLPLLCHSKGRVVTVASTAGRYSFPNIVPYSMSKYAAVCFTDGLRIEMYNFGVKVIGIEPVFYRTPLTSVANTFDMILRTWNKAPEECKALLPADHLDRCKKKAKYFMTYSISHKVEDVVACIEMAIIAENPQHTYKPGKLFSKMCLRILFSLPKPIADLIIYECLERVY